ncbi:hypothetical protein [Streptomyces sp. NPDC003077]|uniref:hypothetical protein n=1 Tax=Streptomyces sp. NPDC003077 TaxID=3154443 RepID=UPI0033BB0948
MSGGLWWWAVTRWVLWPEASGVVEGVVAAGGWGLSLLPVHCVPRREPVGGGGGVTDVVDEVAEAGGDERAGEAAG